MDERYRRQIRFAPLGPRGQEMILSSRVLLVGVGALGSHLASCLVRAGVGELWLVDRDVVELDNLQRQVLFTEEDAHTGRPKAVAAVNRLRHVNATCALHPVPEDFDADVYDRLGGAFDLILDGTDNFATRYLLNDLAVAHDTPWIYGGALGAQGTAMAVLPGRTPCLRCLLPAPPPTGEVGTCETEGVLAPAVATVAAFQSAQALKILAGRLDEVARGVLSIDVWRDRYGLRMAGAQPSPDCPACGQRAFPALQRRRPAPVRLCGRDATQVMPGAATAVDLPRLASRIGGIAEDVHLTPHLLRFVVEDCRFSVFPGGRALLFGVADPDRARILYDRYVGAG
jgi:adenylyltransferase/sulfurtransferase